MFVYYRMSPFKIWLPCDYSVSKILNELVFHAHTAIWKQIEKNFEDDDHRVSWDRRDPWGSKYIKWVVLRLKNEFLSLQLMLIRHLVNCKEAHLGEAALCLLRMVLLKIMGKIEVWSSWSFRKEKLGSLNRAMWMIKNKCLISMQVKVLGTVFFKSTYSGCPLFLHSIWVTFWHLSLHILILRARFWN